MSAGNYAGGIELPTVGTQPEQPLLGGVLLLNLYLLDTDTLECVELVVNPLVSRHHRTTTGVGGSGKMDRQRLAMTRRGLNKFAFVMITDPKI